jgi:hypothetical protein
MKNGIKGLTALSLGLALVLVFVLAGCPQPTDSGGGDGGGSALSGTVTIDGKLLVGEVLTANISALQGEGAASYRWQRGNAADGEFAAIENAGEASYTLAAADNGKYVRVEVSRASYSGTKTSAARGPVSVGGGDEEVDKDELLEAVGAAETAKAAVPVAANAREVVYGTKWAAQTDIDTYGEAIASAQAVIDNPDSTQAEVDAVLAALNTATGTFEAARQDGLLFTGDDAIENMRSYLDSKGQNTTATPYPVYLKVPIAELAGMTDTQPQYDDPLGYLLDNLTRFVELDLRECTWPDGTEPSLTTRNFGKFEGDSRGPFRPNRDNVVSFVVPEGTMELGAYAFQKFTNLRTVILHEPLERIASSFNGCTSLTSIDLPATLTHLYAGTFQGSGLVSIVIPENSAGKDQQVDTSTFYDCSDLESITYSFNVKTLSSSSMAMSGNEWNGYGPGCPKLKTIILRRWNPDPSATKANKITTITGSLGTNFNGAHADLKIYVPNAEAKAYYEAQTYWNLSHIVGRLTYFGE